jgi:hypothetical protein
VNYSSQYLGSDGSGIFSPFSINVDSQSPKIKKPLKKPAMGSCKSMKLITFNDSADFNKPNQSS